MKDYIKETLKDSTLIISPDGREKVIAKIKDKKEITSAVTVRDEHFFTFYFINEFRERFPDEVDKMALFEMSLDVSEESFENKITLPIYTTALRLPNGKRIIENGIHTVDGKEFALLKATLPHQAEIISYHLFSMMNAGMGGGLPLTMQKPNTRSWDEASVFNDLLTGNFDLLFKDEVKTYIIYCHEEQEPKIKNILQASFRATRLVLLKTMGETMNSYELAWVTDNIIKKEPKCLLIFSELEDAYFKTHEVFSRKTFGNNCYSKVFIARNEVKDPPEHLRDSVNIIRFKEGPIYTGGLEDGSVNHTIVSNEIKLGPSRDFKDISDLFTEKESDEESHLEKKEEEKEEREEEDDTDLPLFRVDHNIYVTSLFFKGEK